MITLQQIMAPEKLEEYFQFRYKIYTNSNQSGYLKDNATTDKDIYDDNAIHLGWYVNGELKGCLRFIRPIKARHSLYAFSHMPSDIKHLAKAYMKESTSLGKPFVEVSRICIAKDMRNRKTVTEFVLTTIQEAINRGFDRGLFTCLTGHLPYWLMHGFQILEGTKSWKCTITGKTSYCMTYNEYKLPNNIISRLSSSLQMTPPNQAA